MTLPDILFSQTFAHKSQSIWDHLVHTNPKAISDLSNGDIAANSYYEYKRDVEMMRELGLNIFRISMSWPRILPNGFTNKVSKSGVAFYNNYINEMLKYNITPMVTLYHWDLPQKLQDLGGFSNPLFIDWYEEYVRIVFTLFGDRVKHWITFNQPYDICCHGYGSVLEAPMLNITDVGTYLCAKNLILAHARAYHTYCNDFKPYQGGVVGITNHVPTLIPFTDSDADKFATELKNQGDWGLYTEPIFSKNGGFPKELLDVIAKNSAEQGYKKSRLPDLTAEENDYVCGTYDFFGINHYTAWKVSATLFKDNNVPVPSYDDDVDVGLHTPPEWLKSASPWLTLAPNSLYKTLSYISKKYNNPDIYITENGWSTEPGASLKDDDRIEYYRAAWRDLLDALDDGINIKGYMAWSLMDNFEWLHGYSLLVASCLSKEVRRFPDTFLFGASTSSYQAEGGWNAGDKSQSIWDHLTHTNPKAISDLSNGDIAANSYYEYKRDVEMMRELGLKIFRISMSWPRVLPNGFTNKVSKSGVAFYNNYINEMLKYNITPMVTLYHWDLPQKLQDLGGFSNPLFIDWYEEYVRIVFTLFGDRVKHWITFNQPYDICCHGYGSVLEAPMLNITDVGTYLCAKNLILAHARAYHTYCNDFKPCQGGVVGITNHVPTLIPFTDSDADKFATELKNQGDWGLYTEPIFSKKGGFPKELLNVIAKKSTKQGYKKSRLPDLTAEEIDYVRGTYDFFGINHYSAWKVSATLFKDNNVPVPSYDDDVDVGLHTPPEWLKSASPWLTLAPNSLYKTLSYISKKYNNPDIYITENGWSTEPGASLKDDDRIEYYRAAWRDLLDALDDGINIKGYMAWSLMDNFEWLHGYSECFGLYKVDFNSSERSRTPRKSAFVYKNLIKTRVLDLKYESRTMDMRIDEGE